ncbi:fatty acid desaturase-domain-containing protein [Halteromyces radiatus]|uniref:fatty acid desaturase-domain-containing protein n=1 Tax=Halteromyces radiatus TaxID=101107 RepID=UPI002220C2DA|nr:fatty acid desaturase-domain-containing protein [Halteromyces radiatus]KAI8084594.1 fatty acid desaturase-domain-containing protein [Halteromyces radiatus]
MPPNAETTTCTQDATGMITQELFQARVKKGEALFIFDDKVYKVDTFAARHPGGELAIRHGIGRDVTDEIRSMHPPEVYKVMMKKFYIGDYLPIQSSKRQQLSSSPESPNHSQQMEKVLQASWGGRLSVEAFDEAILDLHQAHAKDLQQGMVQKQQNKVVDAATMRQKYQALEQDLKDRGMFECNRYRYGKECCRYVLLFYVAIWMALRGTCFTHYMISAISLAGFWHQLVFTAHDAGHNEITGRVETDHLIGVIIANFIGGLSLGWWKDNHNVHHIMTNDPEHDPDIQHLPFLAISTRFFQNLYSSYYQRVMAYDAVARFFVARQHHLYYLILAFGRFNLHRLSFRYLLTSKQVRMPRLEWIGIGVFFIWYGSLLNQLPNWGTRVMYILVSYMLTFPLHVQITLSHFGMSTDVIDNEPFPAKQLRTTMDVDCPVWLDWFHGGLQYQAVHHLYPRLPRHNLRLCVPFVRQFCRETGLHYYMYNFSTGNGVILGAMKSVADQIHLMNDVAKYNAEGWTKDDKKQH